MTQLGTTSANREVLDRMAASRPFLIGIASAKDFIPDLQENEFLHAGPPLQDSREACGALKGATLAALVHYGKTPDLASAAELLSAGGIQYRSANDSGVLGTYGGIIGRETPLLIVEDKNTGLRAGAALNEGRGKAVRYGSNDKAALEKLAWLENRFSPMLSRALTICGGVDVFGLIEQSLHMGDDCHSRHKAASALLAVQLAAPLAESGSPAEEIGKALKFLSQNDIFFLPLTMAAGKVTTMSAHGVPGSTIVTCMCGNGVRFGVKLSGAARDVWYTAPVPEVHGKYFQGFSAADAGPMIGDSLIAETIGLGAFAIAAAPALAAYVGTSFEDAVRKSDQMYQVSCREHPRFKVPSLAYRGTPFGIDAFKVVQTGIAPIFNTGIAHKEPGVGQIGAGYGLAPLACFKDALAKKGEDTNSKPVNPLALEEGRILEAH